MVDVVARHEMPVGGSPRAVERSLDRLRAGLDNDETLQPKWLSADAQSTLIAAYARSEWDPEASAPATWDAYVLAMQLSSAVFAAAVAEGESVECVIGGRVRAVASTGGAQYFTDAGTWLTAFWLAVVCREQARLDMLCSVPVALLREADAVYDEYIYAWVEALQTCWREEPGLSQKLAQAVAGTDPDEARVAGPELMLKILYPPIITFYYLMRGDHEKFRQSLIEGLGDHRDFFTADEERANDVEGLIALALLGVACLAFDGGVPVEVESAYLPKYLLERRWIGEYAT